jgi:hypothetical protein
MAENEQNIWLALLYQFDGTRFRKQSGEARRGMGNLRKVTIIVVLGAFILGAVLSSSLAGCGKEDETMGVRKEGIPAIDASAPLRTETATFALG